MMEVATHGLLSRTYTAPTTIHSRMANPGGASPVMQSQSHSSSQFSVNSHPSLRYSDTTQGTSQSTLFPPPPPLPQTPSNGAPVEATDNVLNKVADKETSLFQMCLNLRQRLRGVPGFEEELREIEEEDAEDTDPVTLLWWTFRRGYPLLMIYNTLNPAQPLDVDASKVTESKRGKAATFKFLQACFNKLKFAPEECFIITDLYGDDTTGFVKVTFLRDNIRPRTCPANCPIGCKSSEPCSRHPR